MSKPPHRGLDPDDDVDDAASDEAQAGERVEGAGSDTVVAHLADILFVHILRVWLATQDHAAPSWLRALRDGQIGAALARSATARSTPSPARSPASTARPLAATAASSAPRDSPQQHHEPQNDHIIIFGLEVELSGLMLLKTQNYVNVAKVIKQARTPVLRSL